MKYILFSGIAKHIAASGYGVYAVDHPGFGLSEGLHGYIPSFDDIADNVIEQYTKIKGMPYKVVPLNMYNERYYASRVPASVVLLTNDHLKQNDHYCCQIIQDEL